MTRSILVVDDDQDTREILNLILATLEIPVIQADDGDKALNYLTQHLPLLMVLDLQMPNVDGFTVLQEMKKNNETAKIPVIVFTSQNPEEVAHLLPGHHAMRKGETSMTQLRQVVIKLIQDYIEVDLSLL